MSVKKSAEETAVEKKTSAKKSADAKAVKPAAKKTASATEPAAEKKPAVRKTAKKKAAEVIIQSPLGGEITEAEILARVGNVDKVYVRVDENKAYWVRGDETGSVDLW